MASHIPHPENINLGLHQLGDGDYSMRLPTPEEAGSSLAFAFQSLATIVRATGQGLGRRLPDTGHRIFMRGLDYASGGAASVVNKELFDTSMADTMRVIGDVSLQAGERALRDALNEPTQEGKQRHRHTAEGLLRLAHQHHRSSANGLLVDLVSATNSFIVRTKKIRALEGAATAASLVSAINHHAGLDTTSLEWAATAKRDFDEYYYTSARRSRRSRQQGDISATAQAGLSALTAIWTGGAGAAVLFATAAGTKRAANRHAKQLDTTLPRQQKAFEELHELLTAPGAARTDHP